MVFVSKSTPTVSKPQRIFACGQGRAVKRLPRTTGPCVVVLAQSHRSMGHKPRGGVGIEGGAQQQAEDSHHRQKNFAHPGQQPVNRASRFRSTKCRDRVSRGGMRGFCEHFTTANPRHVPKGRGHKQDRRRHNVKHLGTSHTGGAGVGHVGRTFGARTWRVPPARCWHLRTSPA